jgi:hypothetical protein
MIDYEPQMDINAIAEKYVVEICRLLEDHERYEELHRKALARAEAYWLMERKISDEIYSCLSS